MESEDIIEVDGKHFVSTKALAYQDFLDRGHCDVIKMIYSDKCPAAIRVQGVFGRDGHSTCISAPPSRWKYPECYIDREVALNLAARLRTPTESKRASYNIIALYDAIKTVGSVAIDCTARELLSAALQCELQGLIDLRQRQATDKFFAPAAPAEEPDGTVAIRDADSGRCPIATDEDRALKSLAIGLLAAERLAVPASLTAKAAVEFVKQQTGVDFSTMLDYIGK